MRKLLLTILFCFVFSNCLFAENYYASPSGGGNGRSINSPFRIADFWTVANPGDTLLLLNGRYTGSNSMIKPPQSLSGTQENPIIVMALNDGKVEIDGEMVQQPVLLSYNNYFILEGFNAHSSNGFAVVQIGHGSYNIIRRICAWDAEEDENNEIFGCHHNSEHNLFEDCAGWGTARKIFQDSQGGNYTTWRRCWGRWEYNTAGSGKSTLNTGYNSHHNLVENCICTWDSDMGSVSQPHSLFRGGTLGDRNVHTRIYGCIGYIISSQTYQGDRLYLFTKRNQVDLANNIAYFDPGIYRSIPTFVLYGSDGLTAKNLTSIGGAGPDILSNWNTSNIYISNDASELTKNGGNILNPALNNITSGATIIKRYVNGELTNEDLWPWPMNQRIIDAMILSGHEPVDVTRTIFELGGGTMPDFSDLILSISVNTTSGPPPLTVSFTTNVSGGSLPYNYSWSFGDGSTSNQQNPHHIYSQVGRYIVSLTVTDNDGNYNTKTITINVTDTSLELIITDIKFCDVDQTREITQIQNENWYDLYIYFNAPNGWSDISFADVWFNSSSYIDGAISNRGGDFYAASSYILSYSIASSNIWVKETEGTSEWTKINGIVGLYVDDDQNEYEQNSDEGWAKARVKILHNAENGNWLVNGYVKSIDGVISSIYQKNITILQEDTTPPSAPQNLKAEFVQ
ncbi:MAG: PKD domain-containing protein [Candidatus Hodarchaeota archaeon]